MIAPVIDELAEELTDVKFGKVNVVRALPLGRPSALRSLPTLVLMKDGKPVDRVSSVKQKKDLQAMIERKSNEDNG
jgi:thioredoxin 1